MLVLLEMLQVVPVVVLDLPLAVVLELAWKWCWILPLVDWWRC